MIKIFFPYNDQPRQISFLLNDITYYYEAKPDSANMCIFNNKTNAIVKDVFLDEADVASAIMYLKDSHILPCTKKIYIDKLHGEIGIVGLHNFQYVTIGDIDPHTIGEIDTVQSSFCAFGKIPAQIK